MKRLSQMKNPFNLFNLFPQEPEEIKLGDSNYTKIILPIKQVEEIKPKMRMIPVFVADQKLFDLFEKRFENWDFDIDMEVFKLPSNKDVTYADHLLNNAIKDWFVTQGFDESTNEVVIDWQKILENYPE